MKRLLSLLLIIAILALAMPPKAFAAFTYYRSITVNGGQVPTTQTNFPMLVSGTYSYLATVANGGKVQNANGYDVGFYSNSNCSTGKLNWETELYTATTGEVDYWVNIASISNGTVIYMCYGDASISTDQSAATATWNSAFKNVWHLPNGSSLSANDSTSNGNNGTISTPTATTGQIDGAASFNGTNDRITVADNATLQETDFTVGAWVYITGGAGTFRGIVNKGGGPQRNYYLAARTSNNFGIYFTQGSSNFKGFDSTSGITNNTWIYVVGTYDGTTLTLYKNGAFDKSTSVGGAPDTSTGSGLHVGETDTASESFAGRIDEVHISNTARSADWITTEYNNQSAPASFYTIGAEQGGGGGTPSYYSKWQFSKTIFVFNKVNWVFR